MARDETRDMRIAPNSVDGVCVIFNCEAVNATCWPINEMGKSVRYVPRSQLADLERQFAEAKTERDFWRKKHQDDNEGLMFQLGRNLEFAQAAAFRHGATEPHPTIRCIQIIDEHAESLQRQLADRDTENAELRKRVATAIEKAVQFGGIDGAHHKAWVIDQMVRALTGDDYTELVRQAKAGEDGPETYDWDEGVAP